MSNRTEANYFLPGVSVAKPPRRRLLPTVKRGRSVFFDAGDFDGEYEANIGLTFTNPVCPPIEPTPTSPEVRVPENPPDSPRVNPFDWPESSQFTERRPPPAPTRAVSPSSPERPGYSNLLETLPGRERNRF